MPRVLSIVKFKDSKCPEAKMFDFQEYERFIYHGLVAQDPTKCILQSIHSGRMMVYLPPSLFEEVNSVDF